MTDSILIQIIFAASSVLLLGYVLLLLFYKKKWNAIPSCVSLVNHQDSFVSIIVAARNEEDNIEKLIQAIQNQTYHVMQFELIIIDDFSTDQTVSIIKPYLNEKIRLLELKHFIEDGTIHSYKKKAIALGIQHSKGELIITTDADCIMGKDWLQTIVNVYKEKNAVMLVMPVVIQSKNRLLEIFQTLDFMSLQGITGVVVHHKLMGMCNGANLAYTKTVFNEVGGFDGIDNIASGDDYLLMHKIAATHPNEIVYIKSTNVIVETAAAETWKAFFHQRIRWASKAEKYQDKRIFPVLLLVYFVNLFLCVSMIAAFVVMQIVVFKWLFILFFIKTIFELSFLLPVAKFYQKEKWLWWFPLMQPIHICYTVIAGWLGKFGNYEWKSRNVK
jgi:cellulose synthase/poly-beta-1,6-N-acetylglucosamine synthase-like glycosyltransferase